MESLINLFSGIKNKYYVLGFAITFLLIVLAELTTLDIITISTVGFISTFCSFGFLVKNSNYFKSKFFRLSLIMVSFIIIGSLFKIQHYPGALILISIGFMGIVIFYFIYFLKKINKTLIDYIKLVFITTEITASYLKINHLSYSELLLYYVSPIVFFVLITLIISKNVQTNPNWINQ